MSLLVLYTPLDWSFISIQPFVPNLDKTFCEWNSFGKFETLAILSAILLPIKSPTASAIFSMALFEVVFIASFVDFLDYQEVFHFTYCSYF